MVFRNVGERSVHGTERRIRLESFVATNIQPLREFDIIFNSVKHHDVVVATQRTHNMRFGEIDQKVDHGVGVWASVTVVAKRDDDIFVVKLNVVTKYPQCVEASMNVTNCEMSCQRDSLAR